jgi:hypothetical protein
MADNRFLEPLYKTLFQISRESFIEADLVFGIYDTEHISGYDVDVDPNTKKIILFLSHRDIWNETGFCSDYMNPCPSRAFEICNIDRLKDGVYGIYVDKSMGKDEIIEGFEELGLQYDKEFEEMMFDCEEEELEYY